MTGFARFMLTWRRLSEALAVVIIDALIWAGGVPGPTDLFPSVTIPERLGLMALVLTLWLLFSYARYRRQRRRANRLFAGLSGDTTLSPVGAESELEVEELRQPLTEALAYLREQGEAERGRDFANVLPWLLVLGPPAAGCGTLVEQSDLPMPIEERLGRGGIRTQVAGGTRWWFTDEGLLISPRGAVLGIGEAGKAAPLWRGLLDFLVERRARRPVDGVILVIDAERLIRGEGPEVAATLRMRLQEAMRRFGSRLQVYVTVTKMDGVAGFAEYFSGVDAETRRDAFGVLLPAAEPVGQTRLLAALHAEFERLGQRLLRDLPFRIAADRDVRRRARAAAFPSVFTRLSETVEAFCAELARAGRYDKTLLLRGVFFTSASPGRAASGTSVPGDGPALDPWAPAYAGGLGLALSTAPATTLAGPLFINGLFRRIALPESGLAGSNPDLERRLLLLHIAGYAACLLGLLLSAAVWLSDYGHHSDILAQMRSQARIEATELGPLSDRASLPDIIPPLNIARALTTVDPGHSDLNPLSLSQAITAAQRSYDDLLLALLLPALRRTLEGQLQAAVSAGADIPRIRTLLTTYLELATPGHFSRTDVASWANATLGAALAGQPQTLTDAQIHTSALLDLLPTPLAVNDSLVETARALLRTAPTADEIYTELKSVALRSNLPGIDVVASLGPSGAQLLMLRAQARLPTTVPALYTREGFYQLFLKDAPRLARDLGDTDWILGHTTTTEAQAQALLRQVSDLYVRDYIAKWRVVLDQISLRALPDLGSITAALQTLSGISSPLVQLINLVRM
ncbi:type VI secretion system membrane subunit TssM, partial [Acidisphaera rubrifaciens]|uniref:type VI secretion system membrane subunit TssM n=1 Tax=Acidisphaera rubrifaciens TaxID=50715 RepID=UPI0006626223